MTFRPRMFAAIKGFTPLGDSSSFTTEGMAVDYWHVSNSADAHGHYVSMFPRVVIVLDGKKIPLSSQRHAAHRPYVACYVPAGTEVWSRFETAGHLRHVDIHLSQDRLSALAGTDLRAREPVFLSNATALAPLVDLLADPTKSPLHREKLAECVFLELLHAGQTASVPEASDTPDTTGEILLNELKTHVARNIGRRIDVEELAGICRISRTQLNRIMQRLTGLSPYRWVLLQRIEWAKVLLSRGHGFAEVAAMAGFADQAHFNRVFKSVTGHVPSLWMIAPDPNTDGSNVQYSLRNPDYPVAKA